MRVLVIAPHPDDEVLGCGGTILHHASKGDIIHVCYVTKAYTPDWTEEFIIEREKEIKEATKTLGVESSFLDFPTVKLDTIPQKDLNNSIAEVIKKVKPTTVYVPFQGDLNKDHRLVFEATLVAVRPLSGVRNIFAYETPSETEWGQSLKAFEPNRYVDIKQHFATKLAAMKAYKSEIRELPHPRSLELIESLAKVRGSEVGIEMAEAFVVIRMLEKYND